MWNSVHQGNFRPKIKLGTMSTLYRIRTRKSESNENNVEILALIIGILRFLLEIRIRIRNLTTKFGT